MKSELTPLARELSEHLEDIKAMFREEHHPQVVIVVMNDHSHEEHDRDLVIGDLQDRERVIHTIRALDPEPFSPEEVEPKAHLLPKRQPKAPGPDIDIEFTILNRKGALV
ncbi:MAG: hypothetical protein JJ916_10470 [Phycisphaerales bacterium]|nr:hypothetical protein [Phycisphaerales bacterium]